MTPEQARPGARVRVMEHHRVEERRGLVGKVVARYGGEDYIAVDVRLADGECRLFWPRDLEEISPRRLGGASCSASLLIRYAGFSDVLITSIYPFHRRLPDCALSDAVGHLPRTPVNKDKRKGRGCYAPALTTLAASCLP